MKNHRQDQRVFSKKQDLHFQNPFIFILKPKPTNDVDFSNKTEDNCNVAKIVWNVRVRLYVIATHFKRKKSVKVTVNLSLSKNW